MKNLMLYSHHKYGSLKKQGGHTVPHELVLRKSDERLEFDNVYTLREIPDLNILNNLFFSEFGLSVDLETFLLVIGFNPAKNMEWPELDKSCFLTGVAFDLSKGGLAILFPIYWWHNKANAKETVAVTRGDVTADDAKKFILGIRTESQKWLK